MRSSPGPLVVILAPSLHRLMVLSLAVWQLPCTLAYPAKALKDGPEPGSRFNTLDEMILDADGFAGVFPEHKYEIVKPTMPPLCPVPTSVLPSRVLLMLLVRMRNYSIYACAVTIRIVVCFSILAFAFKFDFPPFMVLVIALLNDGTIMTLSVDRVLPSSTPDS
ncbi:hypothetical protein BDW22DRAFT_1433753 [Trametopsis cervina]|nr:hypothetical protein BDW22DRAFT_1433753 [Trametopsis cervina]